ncbi:AAA family ATPase [Paenibacillus tepidiphilus]|uniref:AAA family ATPase n=1 Tax=Paenibacillus tepidiphilus TaxID=2608683 RepID=UPI00123C2993|nr:AAA family ATPase [Paenibacillus tepidiphilus]
MITVKDLSFSYKDSSRLNLDNFNVQFHGGLINVILGQNGSGKTTFFDIITNVIPCPKNVEGLPKEKEIVYQLQGLYFPNTLKGKDLFRFFLYTNHKNTITITKKPYSDELMSPFELDLVERIWNMEFGKMSVGERRYLSILAITLIDRKLYIFDEPTSGIDPAARYYILKRIEQLALTKKCTVLLSSHTLHDFEQIRCKLYLLHRGKLKFEGTYAEFLSPSELSNPDHAFFLQVQ